ncbi:unannotated protein [freshwater metagenome]|uniref:Type-4 uracil-DNA glycosylase n=1 Tax=freshwater metagenome TaxID=449393 RepID=A0A6J6XDC9_9ZZZZ
MTPDSLGSNYSSLKALVSAAQSCVLCDGLSATRATVVVGHHPKGAKVLVVGEAPGAQEDETGEPFVGKSGQLLDGVLEGVGLSRATVAITSVVKCRPPKNRTPHAGEIANCAPWIDRQVELINPLVVVAMGSVAAKWAMGKTTKIGEVHGQLMPWRDRELMITYHPSAALRFGPRGMPLAAMREDFTVVADRVGV